MLCVELSKSTLSEIAEAIRDKAYVTEEMRPADMAGNLRLCSPKTKKDRNDQWILGTLPTVRIPDGETEINHKFYIFGENLQYVDMPSTIISIGENMFSGCKNLKMESLPRSLQNIGSSAFYNCKSLILESLPYMVTSIGSYAFGGVPLKFKYLPPELEDLSEGAFSGCAFTEIYIPQKVKYIPRYLFRGCRYLTTVTFLGKPDTIREFSMSGNERVLNCPWSEGDIAGAPWGATRAKINYNYIYKEEDNGDSNTVPV